jgi:hypothetical protein
MTSEEDQRILIGGDQRLAMNERMPIETPGEVITMSNPVLPSDSSLIWGSSGIRRVVGDKMGDYPEREHKHERDCNDHSDNHAKQEGHEQDDSRTDGEEHERRGPGPGERSWAGGSMEANARKVVYRLKAGGSGKVGQCLHKCGRRKWIRKRRNSGEHEPLARSGPDFELEFELVSGAIEPCKFGQIVNIPSRLNRDRKCTKFHCFKSP